MTIHHPARSPVPLAIAGLLAALAAQAGAQTLPAACSQAATPIASVQGSGATTPLSGTTVTVQGVVIGDYEGTTPGQRGFYMQSLEADNDPATSEGIFVFNSANTNMVSLGQVVRVTGTAGEFRNQTQISVDTTANPSALVQCGTGSVAPVDVLLPFSDTSFAERYEGMLVRLPQTLTVTEHFQLGRFGQVVVSVNGRQMQPTNVAAPGAAALALEAANQLGRITIDDASQAQNPDPIVLARNGASLSASNTLRGGDTVTGVVGVMGWTFGGNNASPEAWRVRPLGALVGAAFFQEGNPRPASAPLGSGLRVAGFNVLNFFNNVSGCTGGVGGAAMDCRGAGSDAGSLANQAAQFPIEYPRQLAKTVAALAKLDAAVVGLMEIENDGYGAASAQRALVDALNAATAPGRYALIDADARTGQINAMGSDAIKVAFIYQPGRVMPVGSTAALNSVAFVNGGDSGPRNRPALAQAWELPATGERFITVVNHLKSKGSACDAPDAGDGQGNCNAVRVNAANMQRAWLATDPTGTSEPDVLILGDLNAYAKEDPVAAFTTNGWRDLMAEQGGPQAYGYAFNGQWGTLDHALASPTLAQGQVAGAAHWHINADEPSVLDYNVNFKSAGQVSSLFAPHEFRTSDHDPAVVALALRTPVLRRGTAGADRLAGTDADEVFIGGPGRDTLSGGGGRNQFVLNSVLDGGDVITDFRPGRDSLVLTGLLQGISAPPNPLASGHVVCSASGADALVAVDTDGRNGPLAPRPMVLLRNVGCASLVQPDNLRL